MRQVSLVSITQTTQIAPIDGPFHRVIFVRIGHRFGEPNAVRRLRIPSSDYESRFQRRRALRPAGPINTKTPTAAAMSELGSGTACPEARTIRLPLMLNPAKV